MPTLFDLQFSLKFSNKIWNFQPLHCSIFLSLTSLGAWLAPSLAISYPYHHTNRVVTLYWIRLQISEGFSWRICGLWMDTVLQYVQHCRKGRRMAADYDKRICLPPGAILSLFLRITLLKHFTQNLNLFTAFTKSRIFNLRTYVSDRLTLCIKMQYATLRKKL